MKIKDRILILLKEKGDLSVKELTDLLEVSKQAIHIAINQLLEEGTIIKFGKVPKSIYRLQSPKASSKEKIPEISAPNRDYLDKHFFVFTQGGERLAGVECFTHW